MLDRQISVKYATSMNSTNWKILNTTVTAFCDRLCQTTHTPEKAAAYAKMSREDKTATKDVGGFTSGLFEGSRRLKARMQNLEFLKYDIDSATEEQLANLSKCGCRGFWHATHSSTPEDLRIRVIIFTSRRMTLDEGEYLERVFADRYLGGVEAVDKCSYEPHQLMFYPSTPIDIEYECGHISGELLDVDDWLSQSKDWTDRANWPMIQGEDDAMKEYKLLDDPRLKDGVIGAFCSVRTISEAIELDIPGVYEAYKGESRYTYLNGSSAGGALVYDDLWLYSMHATDPANTGHCMNAFDLVRIHKFGSLDKSTPYKDMSKSKSYAAMVEYAMSLPEVKADIRSKRYKKARAIEDFAEELGDVSGMDDEKAYQDICEMLETDKKTDSPLPTLDNLYKIIKFDPRLANFKYNLMSEMIEVTGALPWERNGAAKGWTDNDLACLKHYVSVRYETNFPKAAFDDAINALMVEKARSFHPLRDKIDSLEWDGITRVDEVFAKYLGAEDNEYTRTIARKYFVGAVSRLYRPGCKFDYAIVLCGPQGAGKSSFLEKISMGFFTDNLSITDMASGKEGAERIRGSWIVEIPEMVGMKKTESEAIKAFISRQTDRFRPAYAKYVTEYHRQCVFACTTNLHEGYLRDETGNRRFWPVNVRPDARDYTPWDLSQYVVEQLWAEAKAVFDTGNEELFLRGGVEDVAEEMQRSAMESDPREWKVQMYLDMRVPKGWYRWPVDKRIQYFQAVLDNNGEPDTDFLSDKEELAVRNAVCVHEIVNECFGVPGGKTPTIEKRDASRILSKFDGWEKSGDNKRIFQPYGVQRYFARIEQN